MYSGKRRLKYYLLSFQKHDFRASITVFFVALPLCLGVALASGTPVYSGLAAGVIGGVIIPLFSRSELSVSGPAAGLTAICAGAIAELGSLEVFFLAVAISGLLQILLGVFKLGGFTHFIPSSVIKGMLAAIGVILISKQVPLLLGYNKPDFWRNELFNIITFDHAFQNMESLIDQINPLSIGIGLMSLGVLLAWKKYMSGILPLVPASFATVLAGSVAAWLVSIYFPAYQLDQSQLVNIPHDVFAQIQFPDWHALLGNRLVWKTALVIALVATLETLLSVEAIDKLDPYNRITPKNRELVAQGIANFSSGMVGGLPVTAVIVRSSANAEAGGKTSLSAFAHGIWLAAAVVFAIPLLNHIPYCVLAVLLIRTGYNLAKPRMLVSVYRQGNEQFMPFIVTIGAILFTDLLIGVLIGIGYSIYFLIKHTYRAGFVVEEKMEGHIKHITIKLAMNVSFLNKRRLSELLDQLPDYSVVEIKGADSVYIDHDILEIIQSFRAKAKSKHIELHTEGIREVQTIEVH
ncbi:MAG: SulP family inorganic anion transporter [Saprospiraceae bacterium]|nr:SulP family inorganic anion transporter [Saprospiraceae bacterium]